MPSRSIKGIIYGEYRKAALVPILVIAIAFLIVYFGIINYIERNSKLALIDETAKNVGEITGRSERSISLQLEEIYRLASILQKENTRVFSEPAVPPDRPPPFAFAPNKTYYKSVDNGGSSVWYSGVTPIGEAERQKASATEVFDPLFKAIYESNPNIVAVYFNSHDSMCRYYPFLPTVYEVFAPDMRIPDFNFYYLADAEHDPERSPVWTAAYLDPAGKGWMASCVVPIYRGDFLEGVTGIDVTIDKIVENILALDLPWSAGGAFLVDETGVILAMSETVENIFGIKELRQHTEHEPVLQDTAKPEEFNLLKNRDPGVVEQIKTIFASDSRVNDFGIGGKNYLLAQAVIERTRWRLLILADKDAIYEPIYRLDRLAKLIGMVVFVCMLAFYGIFFAFLLARSRKIAARISRPIEYLAEKSTEMRERPSGVELAEKKIEIEEIDRLYGNFRGMADELGRFYEDLEGKVRQRTAELEAANAELKSVNLQLIQQEKMASIGQLAAGVAHEINNPMGFVISNIAVMRDHWDRLDRFVKAQASEIKSLRGSPDGEPAEGPLDRVRNELDIDFIREDSGNLFADTLDGAARVKTIVSELRTFSRTTTKTEIGDINKGIEGVLNLIKNELTYKVTLALELGTLPPTRCNIGQLNQVFMNILMNAVQSIRDKGTIRVRTWVEQEKINVSIQDDGMGIPAENLGRIFDPFFTTKPIGAGTGLGLSISYEIIKQHGGSIRVESEPGVGTVFTVTIPIVSV